jgi:uncharacterized membrane protein (UPF0127 family)
MRAVLSVGLLAGLTTSAECQRSPPEDFGTHQAPVAQAMVAPVEASPAPAAPPPQAPAQVSSGAALPDASAASARCVQPTPAEPPPPVAPGPAPGCPPDPENGGPKLPEVTVKFTEQGASVVAEVVVSPHDTQRGLMYRRSMAEGHGMLFDERIRSDHEFWMHNTCIPLDLLYVDQDGLIVGIVENAPTLDDTPRSVGCLSRYVLEVNAGWCRRHSVKAGQHMSFPALY